MNAFSGTINLSYVKPLKYKDMLTFYKTIRKGERKNAKPRNNYTCINTIMTKVNRNKCLFISY